MFDSEKSKIYRMMIRVFSDVVYFVFEKPKGVDFIRMDAGPQLISPSASCYISIPARTMDKILKDMRIGPEDSFLDIGCGKGFVLRRALESGFGKVHGIDISEELCRVAALNMKTLKLSDRATVECADAARFRNLDEYSFIFMNNPFSGEVMKTVVHNIELSLMRKPRNLTIIYLNPRFYHVLDESVFLKLTRRKSVSVYNPLARWSVYYYNSIF